MSIVTHPPRVAYILSSELIHYSDLLPSNLGRSSLVHSLAYHLDLLDLGSLHSDSDQGREGELDSDDDDDDDDDEDPDSIRQADETSKCKLDPEVLALLKHFGVDQQEYFSRRDRNSKISRAKVYAPHRATKSQLTGYHEKSFVEYLCRKNHEGVQHHQDNAPPRKRVKSRHHPTSNSNNSKRDRDRDSDSKSSDEGDDPSPSSSLNGAHGQRGYKRSLSASTPAAKARNQFGLQDDCPVFAGLSTHVELVAGASITAAELLAVGEADIAIVWDGGRHHAKKDSASGFCYINDAVLAILALRKPRKINITTTIPDTSTATTSASANANANEKVGGGEGEDVEEGARMKTISKTVVKRMDRVMYIDLDLHWGDGVEEAFCSSCNVLTLSVHHYAVGFFPCHAGSSDTSNSWRFGPAGSLTCEGGASSTSLSIPLGVGTSTESFSRVMGTTIQSLYEAFKPEAVVVQCGVDGLASDPMSVWNLSTTAYVEALVHILAWKKPTLLLGGGGYKSTNAAKTWCLLTAVCLQRFKEQEPTARTGRTYTTATDTENGDPNKAAASTSSSTTHSSTRTPSYPNNSNGDFSPRPPETHSHTHTHIHTATHTNEGMIGYSTSIPIHKYWPNYAPDHHALGINATDSVIDTNDEGHFEAVQKTFLHHCQVLSSSSSSSALKNGK